jgi:predicted metal-binding membrane protein
MARSALLSFDRAGAQHRSRIRSCRSDVARTGGEKQLAYHGEPLYTFVCTAMTSTSRNSGAPDPSALERVLRQDRLVVVAALAAVVVIAWAWLILGAGTGMSAVGMTRGSGMPAAGAMGCIGAIVMAPAAWSPGYGVLMLLMWWVMMAAMMLPAAAPMILLFARVNRGQKGARPYVPTAMFAAGYLLAWGGFSLLATALQWGLERSALLSTMMVTTSWWLGGAILLAAGIWQLTPVKNVCLRHCRSPLGFLMQAWRPGRWGALRMGLEHGSFCLGCCWFLMGLLFFGGVMNLFWIAGLALFVLLEKTVPFGLWFARAAGVVAAAAGIVMLVSAST